MVSFILNVSAAVADNDTCVWVVFARLKKINMKKCKVCGEKTEVVFNIDFKATPICEGCATAIFLQQAKWYAEWYAETQGQKLPIHNVISSFCHHNGTYTTTKDDEGNEICCKCRKPLAK